MDKQLAILNAALPLFVANGFHGTPTSRVAQEAGVSNGTLFHYFKTKDDLVIALYNHVKDQLAAHLAACLNPSAPVAEQFRVLFIESVNWALQQPQAMFYIQQFHFSPHLTQLSAEVIHEQTRLHRALIQRGLAGGILKPLPEALIFTLVSSQVFGTYQYAAALSGEARQQAIRQSCDLLWDALTP